MSAMQEFIPSQRAGQLIISLFAALLIIAIAAAFRRKP